MGDAKKRGKGRPKIADDARLALRARACALLSLGEPATQQLMADIIGCSTRMVRMLIASHKLTESERSLTQDEISELRRSYSKSSDPAVLEWLEEHGITPRPILVRRSRAVRSRSAA